MEALYQTLIQRKRPEDVAAMILTILSGELTREQTRVLEKAAAGSLKNRFLQYTSMAQVFANPVGAGKQVQKTTELFRLHTNAQINTDEPAAVEAFIREVSPLIHKEFGKSDYQHDRLSKLQRQAEGMDISKRQYNKLFRQLRFLEKKLTTMIREYRKCEFQQVAKHGLAHRLSFEEFAKDKYSACFIAYYTARCNLRSEFTIAGQQRPYDEIADMLFRKCAEPRTLSDRVTGNKSTIAQQANYFAIAFVYPDPQVLAQLTDVQKGQLLGQWTAVLQDIAQLLADLWKENDINRDTMVVKRGNDSSTWNHTAGAWNKARDAWMNIIYALGLEFVLDEMCFGKVLRLMAADVVAWHYRSGGQLDPNTQVWNSLPLPWEVFDGTRICTRQLVKEVCEKAGLDPKKSGWIAHRPHGVVSFQPTPELVHGVSIANPFLATVLKKSGYYSGKPGKVLQTYLN